MEYSDIHERVSEIFGYFALRLEKRHRLSRTLGQEVEVTLEGVHLLGKIKMFYYFKKFIVNNEFTK